MSQGQNSSSQREKNEKIILLLIRKHQQISKADIAHITCLTYPAVARIVDNLEDKGLVRKKGILKKQIGKPTTIYEINGVGQFAIGIEIRDQKVVIAVIDFQGTPLIIKESATHLTPINLSNSIYKLLFRIINSLDIEQRQKIIGIGLVNSENENICMLEVKHHLTALLKTQNEHSLHNLSIIVASHGIATAATEILKNSSAARKNVLYIYIGKGIDGCFIFSNKINLHRPREKKFLASMPISLTRNSVNLVTQYSTLNEQSSLDSLQRDLIDTSQWPIIYSDLMENTSEANIIVMEWIQRAANALAFSIEASASLHQLDEVILGSSIHQAWLSVIVNNIREKVSYQLTDNIRSASTGNNAAIIGSAALLLIDGIPD